jgi:hypothetical protein
MAYKKGQHWTGNKKGRPKGSANRSSEMQKINIQRMINEGLDYLKEDYHAIREEDPAKAVSLLLKMMEYSIPKLKSVEVKGELEHKIQQISVNINKGDGSQH